MLYRIPVELADLVLDNLHADKRTLLACSLVCRAWLPIARHHLLSCMTVKVHEHDSFSSRATTTTTTATTTTTTTATATTLTRLDRLLSSPLSTLAPHISRLHFKGSCPAFPPRLDPSTLASIRTLPHVRSVAIEDMAWMLVPAELKDIITSFDLTSLALSFVVFPTPGDLAAFFSAFPNLASVKLGHQVLCLQHCEHAEQDDEQRPCSLLEGRYGLLKPLRCIRKLSLDASREPLISMFLHLCPPASIDVLKLRSLSMSQISIVDAFLDRTAPKHLTLDFGRMYQGHDIVKPNFSTSWHFRLRSLTIEGLISRCYRRVNLCSNWSACIALLSTIRSCKLESLTICLKNLSSADHLDWTTLDDMLARDTFRNVKAMTFRIFTIIDHVDSSPSPSRHHQRAVNPMDIAARLPGAHSRGVLNFV